MRSMRLSGMARSGTLESYFAPRAHKRTKVVAVGDGEGTVGDAGTVHTQETIARAKRLAGSARDQCLEMQTGGKMPALRELLLEDGWKRALEGATSSTSFQKLEDFVAKEWKGPKPIYPPAPCVFHAFHSCALNEVKVVILGQDPYHGPGQAMGLSFSVPRGQRIPPSLQNIYKEIHDDLGIRTGSHGDLTTWAQQGVFLLNTVLTVRAGEANSHVKQGWEEFTDAAIRTISKERKGVVFLLWGKHAQAKEKLIDTTKHHVLKSVHPSGLSAHRGFFGCKHFSKTNAILRTKGVDPIDWSVPS